MEKDWIEVEVITSSEATEAVSGFFYNHDVQGVSIEDPNDMLFKKKHPAYADLFDESIIKVSDGSAIVKGYFREDENFKEAIKDIEEKVERLSEFGLDKGEGLVTYHKVNEEDWENNWKKYYKPTKVGNKIVVKPIWEEYAPKDGEVIVELDPGIAFGTGTHETTRMCIKALEKYVKECDRVFDIGTGSGILSIAASKLGAREVVGVDLDPVAVDSAKENVSFNHLQNVEILEGDLTEVVEGKADIIVANLLADIVLCLCESVKTFMSEGSYFISSGILNTQCDKVVARLKELELQIVEIMEDGEWVCIVAKR